MLTYRITWAEVVYWSMKVDAEDRDDAEAQWEGGLVPLVGAKEHQLIEDEGGMVDGSLEIMEADEGGVPV